MGGRQVGDMNIIPDRRSIRSREIRSVELERRGLSEDGRQNIRNEVRLRIVTFSEFSFRICTGGVEIAERDELHPVGAAVIGEDLLDDDLCLPVGIDGIEGMGFRDLLTTQLSSERIAIG